MKLKQLLPSLLLLILSAAAFAQSENPFASIGKKGKILTLTKGQYNETFDADTIQQIGSSLINMRTMKVVKLLTDDESKKRLEGEKHSRFLSKDPLTGKYAGWTPYAYAMNDVIRCIDLDGAEKKIVIHWIDGLYGDGTPKITNTTVSINQNIVFINTNAATGLPLNDGKKYAGTEIYYALPDGRFVQGQTMYEEIVPGGIKASANYDYTKNVMPTKNADDAAYASSKYDAAYAESEASGTGGSWGAGAGAWVKAYAGITGRDANATDNAVTMESLSGVSAALIVIAHTNLKPSISSQSTGQRNVLQDIFQIKRLKGNTEIAAGTEAEALSIGKSWVNGDKVRKLDIKDGVGFTDGSRSFRLQWKPQDKMWKANFEENTISAKGQISQTKNVHMNITDKKPLTP